jgi:hypothetical protein
MYRPQFAYSTPPGCRDEDFIHYFDSSNVPLLASDVNGLTISNIPLPLDRDAPFYWRGIKVALRTTSGGVAFGDTEPNFSVKFRDVYDNDLSDDLVPAVEYAFPMNPLLGTNFLVKGPPVPLEPEIYCPPGGVILAFIQVPSLSRSVAYFPEFAFFGVKRFKECE